jgi:hypothetical protein
MEEWILICRGINWVGIFFFYSSIIILKIFKNRKMNRTHFTLELLFASLFMLQVSGLGDDVYLISDNHGQDSSEEDMHSSSEQEENTDEMTEDLGGGGDTAREFQKLKKIPSKKNSFDYSRSLFNMLRNQNEYEE